MNTVNLKVFPDHGGRQTLEDKALTSTYNYGRIYFILEVNSYMVPKVKTSSDSL